jgi:ribosomal protein S18 acetylase RimI-like enzyme
MPDVREIRRASTEDAEALAEIMGAAFQDDPVSTWIFPDPDERRRLQPDFFGAFVNVVLAEGLALTTTDLAGLTLWLDVDPGEPEGDAEQLHLHMRNVLGDESAARFRVLDEMMTRLHPHHAAHAYLPFIAVHPDKQGQGVGEQLLRARLDELDATGTHAYLEASGLRNAKLYQRLGFEHREPTLDLPDGPTLYPMWRPPAD